MRRLLVALLATVAGLADAQDGGCTDFMTMQANYMALVSLLSAPAGFGSEAASDSGAAVTPVHTGDGRVLRRAGRGLLRRLPRHLCVPASPA